MASMVYDSYWSDQLTTGWDLDAASGVKVLLTTSAYTPNKRGHTNITDVTASEVASGNGYTTGGITVTPTVVNNRNSGTPADTIVTTLPGGTWTTAAGQTLTARVAVYYKATGGNLIAAVDFGTDQIAGGGGTLTLGNSTITINNA